MSVNNYKFHHFCLLGLAVCLQSGQASENGGYYVCNATLLSTENKCVFSKSDTAPQSWTSVGPHDMSGQAGGVHSYLIKTADDVDKPASPVPLTNGDKIATTTADSVAGVDWMWVMSTEISFKMRNAMMYTPEDLQGNLTAWDSLNVVFTDCHIKDSDVTVVGEPTGYGRDSVYTMLSDPNGNSIVTGDIHNQVLQFLEEGAIDLACLMVDSSVSTLVPSFVRCPVIRDAWNLADTEMSDCWVAGYTELFGEPDLTGITLTTSTYGASSDDGNDDICFHVESVIDYKGVEYTYEELKAGKEPECTVPHSPSSKGVIISTSCDKTVRVTDSHLMATSKGFQLAYSLKVGDVLFGDYSGEQCVVNAVEKEKTTQQYFGLNCVYSEVLASGLRASTFGDFHTLPSWYMTYVGSLVGSDTASYLGEYIAEWYF